MKLKLLSVLGVATSLFFGVFFYASADSTTTPITESVRIIGLSVYDNTNFGAEAVGEVAWYNNSDSRQLFRAVLPNISGTITGVTLNMHTDSNGASYTGTTPTEIRKLTQTGWTQAGATWNKYDGSNNWTTPGGDMDTDQLATFSGTGNTTYAIDIYGGTALSSQLAPTFNSQVNIILKGYGSYTSTYYSPDTEVNSNAGLRPYLTITYTPGGGGGGATSSTSSAAVLFTAMASSTGQLIQSSLPIFWGVLGFTLGLLALLLLWLAWKPVFKFFSGIIRGKY